MAKKSLQRKPTAKILALTLPAAMHRRFLSEVARHDGNGTDGHERFLSSLMKKYLALNKKKRSQR